MSILDTVRSKAKEAGRAARRQAKVGRQEVAARQLEGKVRKEQLAIGKAVYPRLKDGSLSIEDDGVRDSVARAVELEGELASVRETIDAIKSRADGFMPEEDGMPAATGDAEEEQPAG